MTAPEPVTRTTEDPRVDALARAYLCLRKTARDILVVVDAADATAGIRRVPASGICGDTFDGVLNGVLGPCCLPSGHSGWHCEERSDDVPPARWSHGESEPAGGAS